MLGRLVYTSREADALAHVLAKDDPRKPSRKTEKLRLIDLRDTVIDWRLYGHIVSAFLSS